MSDGTVGGAGEAGGAGPAGLVTDAAFLQRTVHGWLARNRGWRQPPGWSRPEWNREASALGVCCACEALGQFDPGRGVELEKFVQTRVANAVFVAWRTEVRRWRRDTGPQAAAAVRAPDRATDPEARLELSLLREAMAARLSGDDRWLIEQLFFLGRTEAGVAAELGMRQQSLNERKRRVLAVLREALAGAGRGHFA